MTEAPVVEQSPNGERQLTRAEAYDYLTNALDRIDRDVSVMIQGAGSVEEADNLWLSRKGLLEAQKGMSFAKRAGLVGQDQ